MLPVPSTQRPIPLAARPDLRAEPMAFGGDAWWVVKDPVALDYHRLRDEQYRALRLLDGRRSLEDLRAALCRECPAIHLTLADLQRLVTGLHQKALVRSERLGQGAALHREARRARRARWTQAALNPLSIQLPGLDPQRLLDRLLPWLGWLFHPLAMCGGLLAALAALGFLVVHLDELQARLPAFSQFFGWPNLVWLWLTLGAAKILHEVGHGLACRRYGAECHQMGVLLLVFTPCLYCDASDSWMLSSKWKRIAIGAAGMHVEAVLSTLAIIVWWNTSEGLLSHLCLNLFFVSAVTTIAFNLNPLMRFDGYYILADLLEVPNLRAEADRMLREQVAWVCLGLRPASDPFGPRRRGGFLLFAAAAWIYRWVLLFSIAWFLCTALRPYGLQSVGMTAAALTFAAAAASLCIASHRLVTAPREAPMSRRRIAGSVVVGGLLLAVALLVPLPLFLEAPFLVEPRDVEHVFVPVSGRLVEARAAPGDRVGRGALLAVLSDPELDDRRRGLETERSAQELERRVQHALGDSAQRALADARLRTLAEQIRELDAEMAQLRIVAPCDGVVVAPEPVPAPRLDAERSRLGGWHGAPLDAANVGAFLERATHLLSIAPDPRLDALILVDQSHRDALRIGQTVSLKLDELPDATFSGTLREIARKEERFAPASLSNKQGGGLATVTDSSGRERLADATYLAIGSIEPIETAAGPGLIRPGMRGRARIATPRSLGDWLWRTVRQMIHFRL